MHPEPSKSPLAWRLRRPVLAAVGAAALVAIGVVAVTGRDPEFYRQRLTVPEATGERAARRLVTKLSALQAAAGRPGPWEAAITEDEINAWLALDLPRNHPRLLPGWLSAPRVRLGPGRLDVAARVAVGPLSAPARVALDVRLRGVNELEIAVAEAGLGSLPLPRGLILHRLAEGVRPLGAMTELRRLDGGGVLVVRIPATRGKGGASPALESLALAAGELLVAGATEERR
jgi:hypothetical protein